MATVISRLSDLLPYIDWSPFFHTWETARTLPGDSGKCRKRRKLFDDAQALLDRIVSQKLLVARGGVWLLPGERRGRRCGTLHGRFAQTGSGHVPFPAPADGEARQTSSTTAWRILSRRNSRPRAAPLPDYLGAFAVSTGFGFEELCEDFERDHDDYNSIMTKALADRLAEAFAEFLHKRARDEWAMAVPRIFHGGSDHEKLSWHPSRRRLSRLPRPHGKTDPLETPGCGKARGHQAYRNLRHVARRQRERPLFRAPGSQLFRGGKDCATKCWITHRRKQMEVPTVERWLGPSLNYKPGAVAVATESPEAPAKVPGCACGQPHQVPKPAGQL